MLSCTFKALEVSFMGGFGGVKGGGIINRALTILTWLHCISSFRGLEPQTLRAAWLPHSNSTVAQVHVRNRIVDFQCFGKGLWTKTVANHVKPENLYTRRSATLLGNIKPCPPGKIWSEDHESKSRWLSAKTRYYKILLDTCIGIFL